jgi:TPR repeat protein
MARLGHMLARGSPAATQHTQAGHAVMTKKAIEWFHRSASDDGSNLPSAVLGIAAMLLHGNGTDPNHGKAFDMLSAVADANAHDGSAAEAQYLLGVMWLQGRGVPERSTLQAQRLFTEAAAVWPPRPLLAMAAIGQRLMGRLCALHSPLASALRGIVV